MTIRSIPSRFAVSAGGTLEATDTTITDLGSPPVETDNGRAGLAFGPGSRGTLIRTTLLRNTTGLELSRSDAVRLRSVTVGDSTADGIVLHGDRGTTMSDIRTERNRGNGVLVSGESTDRRITGISTAANGAFGVVWGGLDERVAVRGAVASAASPVPAGEVRSFGPRHVHDVRNSATFALRLTTKSAIFAIRILSP